MNTRYQGRIVMTPQPDLLGIVDDPDIQKLLKKPNRSTEKEIDPTSVSATQQGYGPLYYRPAQHADCRRRSSEWSPSSSGAPLLSVDSTNTLYNIPSSMIILDVYIYNDTPKNGHFQLHRKSREPLMDTLRRLLMKYQQMAVPKKKTPIGEPELLEQPPIREDRAHIWRLDTAASSASDQLSNSQPFREEVDPTLLTNLDLCQLGVQSPLVITVQSDDSTTPSCFLLESYPPTVYSVSTFDYWGTFLYVGVPVAIQVETLYATHSRVDWYVDGYLYQTTWDSSHMYIPIPSHINKKVTLVIVPCRIFSTEHPNSHNGMGCEKAFRFHKLVSPLPTNAILQMRLQWLKDTARNDPTHSNSTAKRTIRVLTYNILANINARCSDYPNVAASILSKERRCPLIVHEILQYQADILCLQEVDFIVFETLLLPILQQYNYQGYYSGKKAESSNEGCATFWSLSTFAAVPPQDQKSFLIRDLLMRGYGTEDEEWSDVYENLWSLLLLRPDLEMVLATRLAHIAQMVPLTWSNHSSSSTIWVTNTHLYYHPQASHLRLLQMLLLTRQIAAELRQRPGELISCGDFNSSLEHSAGKLVLDRSVPANFRYSQEHLNTFRDRTWSDEDVIVEREDDFPSFSLPPSFPTLHSGVDPVPPFTHISHEFCGTLDHILYSCRGLRYQSSAPMPSISDVSTALPSPNVPSDHVSLISDLEVVDLRNEMCHQGATIMENIEEKA